MELFKQVSINKKLPKEVRENIKKFSDSLREMKKLREDFNADE